MPDGPGRKILTDQEAAGLFRPFIVARKAALFTRTHPARRKKRPSLHLNGIKIATDGLVKVMR